MHCSIFKMLFFFRSRFSAEAFLLYHIFSFLSSTFFKFFQKLFDVIASLFSRPAFLLYHISFILSSTFFKFFQNLFEMFTIRLADSLFIISLFFSLVKCFFQISLNFFTRLSFFQKEKIIYKFLLCQTQLLLKPPVLRQQSYRSAPSCLVRQLYYYSTFFRLCQLKVKFWKTCYFISFQQLTYRHIYFVKSRTLRQPFSCRKPSQ